MTNQLVYILFVWFVYGCMWKTTTFQGIIVLHQNGLEFNRKSIGGGVWGGGACWVVDLLYVDVLPDQLHWRTKISLEDITNGSQKISVGGHY